MGQFRHSPPQGHHNHNDGYVFFILGLSLLNQVSNLVQSKVVDDPWLAKTM